MSRDDELLMAVCTAATVLLAEDSDSDESSVDDRRSGRAWEGPMTKSRKKEGAYYTTVPNLIIDNDEPEREDGLPSNRVGTFQNYFRLSKQQFDHLLALVAPKISKQDTHYRECIKPEERLMITLRYLATGSSFTSLHYEWCISLASISEIIPQTSRAIIDSLKGRYMTTPNDADQWRRISMELEENWNFPNALGCLDGKHIAMNKPYHAGSEYHKYKGFESVMLLGMCDANYSFTYVDVGAQGRASDGGVFNASTLYEAIEDSSINFPSPRSPPGADAALPYVILADEAFPLKNYLMRPYAKRTLNHERRVFKYRLCRIRRLIENAFGILTNTWRIISRRIDLQPDKVCLVTLACCALHNFIRSTCSPPKGAPPQQGGLDIEQQYDALQGLQPLPARPSAAATACRDQFCDYVNGVGAVERQNDYVLNNM